MLETEIEVHGNNKNLRVARLGSGEAVILLHGYPENLQVFDQVAPILSQSREVIAFDWPGMGASEERKGGATPLIMANRLRDLMAEWHIEKADLVAQDMGGQPALVFAAIHPERVRSVVVMNSLVAGDMPTSWEIKWLRKFGINRLLLHHFGRLVFWRSLFTFLPKGYTLNNELKKDMWKAFRRPAVRSSIIRMCAGYEGQLKRLPEYYRLVKCPVLLLWGEKDKHFPPVQAYKLKEFIPHARIEVLRDATHWMALARAEEVAGKINDFLNGDIPYNSKHFADNS